MNYLASSMRDRNVSGYTAWRQYLSQTMTLYDLDSTTQSWSEE